MVHRLILTVKNFESKLPIAPNGLRLERFFVASR